MVIWFAAKLQERDRIREHERAVDGIYASVGITVLFLADKWQKPGAFGENVYFKLYLKGSCVSRCTDGKLIWETHSLKWEITHYHLPPLLTGRKYRVIIRTWMQPREFSRLIWLRNEVRCGTLMCTVAARKMEWVFPVNIFIEKVTGQWSALQITRFDFSAEGYI